ncbi:MAG: hypothetical protein NT062_37620 [Proteobacteria bacterium]|nr:hypothetical protein [Pseudomonadota bacterium]
MLKAGALASLLTLVACGVGDDGTTPDPTGRQCSTYFKTTGSVTGQTAIPDNDGDGQPDISGCWPQGKWTFTTAIDTANASTCSPSPTPLPSYEVQIDYGCYPVGKSCDPGAPPETAGNYGFETKLVTATDMRNKVKYSSGGGGLCEGLFELFSADGKEVWNFHPTLNADLSIKGSGEFSRYSTDQWTD